MKYATWTKYSPYSTQLSRKALRLTDTQYVLGMLREVIQVLHAQDTTVLMQFVVCFERGISRQTAGRFALPPSCSPETLTLCARNSIQLTSAEDRDYFIFYTWCNALLTADGRDALSVIERLALEYST